MENFEITVEISAKHVHLTPADVEKLFGTGAVLTFKRDLSQPGQFLSEQRVSLVGPKRTMENVAVLGPVRGATQVEVSFTDARTLGAENVPVRESGDLKGSAPIKIVGRPRPPRSTASRIRRSSRSRSAARAPSCSGRRSSASAQALRTPCISTTTRRTAPAFRANRWASSPNKRKQAGRKMCLPPFLSGIPGTYAARTPPAPS